ncbi:MAG: type IV pilus assembly protein PilM [Candidatus Methylomirabilis oxygeniifera]|nr:MAG: type IV pilus assembly protein PilM [Candidatus Methylomirabilis oxyfera]
MMFSWMTPHKELVGLDIGTSSIKAVHLQPLRSSYKVAELGIVPIHPETIIDGIIMDATALSTAIRQLFDEHGISLKDVAFSVSGHSVIIKKIKVPAMKTAELREGIAWEAERHIPYSIEDVNLDFQILREAGSGELEMDVLLVAVKKDTLNDYLAVISAAGLNAAVVDVDSFAIENAFTMPKQPQADEIVALVNVGAAVTTINILYGGISDFTRDSPLGGNRHTESLQRSMGVSFEQAEALKRGELVDGHSIVEAEPVIETVNSELAGEIRRSFDFYYSTSQRDTIHRMVLSGGCTLLSGLAPYLSHALELPVEIANPFQHLSADPKKFDVQYLARIAPQMTVAVGLALREAEDGAG